MALSKTEKKEAKAAERALKKQRRDASKDEVMSARVRTGMGFGGAYILTQLLPAFAPSIGEKQAAIDLLLAGGGLYFTFTNDDELGDFALGAALVGLIQTFDNIGAKLKTWLKPAAA